MYVQIGKNEGSRSFRTYRSGIMSTAFLMCMALVAPVYGQVTQPLPPDSLVLAASFYPHSQYPRRGEVGDVNGDGRPDFVTLWESGFAVFVGNGDKTFQAAKEITAGRRCSGMDIGDWNRDGLLDTAMACDGVASLYLRSADGSYQRALSVAAVSGAAYVRLVDLNADKFLDLVVTQDFQGGQLYVFLGTGNSSLPIPLISPLTMSPRTRIYVADFNGDKKLDLAQNSDNGLMSIHWGHGDGSFRPGPMQRVGRGYLFPEILVEDVDNDGIIDLVVPPETFYGNDISILYGNGDGSFAPAQLLPVLTNGKDEPLVFAPALVDLDQDGLKELFVTAATDLVFGNKRVLISRRLGPKAFGKFEVVQSVAGLESVANYVGWSIAWTHVVDLDRNGSSELILQVTENTRTGSSIHGIRVLEFTRAGNVPGTISRINSIRHGATFASSGFSAGCLVSIFGWGFGPDRLVTFVLNEQGKVPDKLGGIQVLFNKVPAPLLAVSDTQINAIIPFSLAGTRSVEVEIVGTQFPANKVTFQLSDFAPGFFPIVINQDGRLNGDDAPASPGDWLVFYLTGVGPLTPSPVDGSIAVEPFSKATTGYTASILETSSIEIGYLGPAPGLVYGVWQLNVQLPPSLIVKGRVPLDLRIGTLKASATFVVK
jgi:uncharacterized protein (TIGR03437 family)